MTDPLGQSQVIPYLSELSRKGYRFHLISFEKPERFDLLGVRIRDLLERAGIAWYPCIYTKRPPVLSTLKDLRTMNRKAQEIIHTHKIQLIHCRSYISAMVGLDIKKKFNIPFIFDMRGFWADERVDGKIWNLKNPVYLCIYQFFKKREKDFLTKSAHIISLTRNAANEILSWRLPGLLEEKITVIPCCADTDFFNRGRLSEELLSKKRVELGVGPENDIMIYLGSLGTWYMAEEMIRLFHFLKKEKPGLIFLIVTKDDTAQIRHFASRYGISEDSLRFVSAEREEVPVLIAMSQISVFFILPSYSKKASSPTKLAELMAMGVPVICNSGVGDVAEIISQSKAGWVINSFNDDEMRKAAVIICQSPSTDAAKLRKSALEYGSLAEGVNLYAGVYAGILRHQP